jgi:hypothetical protein
MDYNLIRREISDSSVIKKAFHMDHSNAVAARFTKILSTHKFKEKRGNSTRPSINVKEEKILK